MKKLWKKIKAWFKKHFGDEEDFTETATGGSSGSSSKPKTKPNADGDEVAFSALNFCYGGFKPKSDAKVCARIRSLSVGKGMSYRWDNGGCENLGCKDAKDANALAQGFNNAHRYAFVILSKDGAKRTNVITC